MSVRKLWRRAIVGAFAAGCAALASTAASRPITLSEALAGAQGRSPTLAAARASVAAAEARARQAGVSPNPELEIEVENVLGSGPYSGLSGTELTLAVGQRFERGGKRSARRRLAQAEIVQARLALERTSADVSRDVRLAFAELIAAEERLAVARDASERAAELARTARILVEAGRDPPLRQLRADALLAEARAAEQQAVGALANASRALATLAALPEGSLEAEGPPSDLAGAPQPAGTQLLGIRIAEAERQVAAARIDVEQAMGVPDVTARAGLRGFAETDDIALVGGISMPLPVRDRNRGGIAAARSELLAAEARTAQARLDASREAQDARTLLAAADARVAALQGAGTQQATEAVRVARAGYAAGKFSLLDVLDAETALNNARASLIDARRDRARALAALERAQAQ
jgi:cobalt-zinc-cadmium efflux system outer membrane protein